LKKIRVKYRKLGKEKADGLAHIYSRTIEIDERLKGKRALGALFHECMHHANPTAAEEEVQRIEKEIVPIIWREFQKHPERYLKTIKRAK
jgi:hypothetical protein